MNSSRGGDLIRFLHRLEGTALVALMGSLILLAFAQIALRNLFSITLLWAEPLLRHLVLWSGFLGALIATRRDKHIRIDAFLRLGSPPTRALLQSIAGLFSAAVCLLLFWVSIQFLQDERAFDTRTFLDIPSWYLQLIFPLTFGGMALRFFSQSGRKALEFYRGRPQ